LISLVKGEPKYKPNEDEIKVATLETYIGQLGTLNKGVDDTRAELNAAKRERNIELYIPEFGISELTGTVKKYVRSVVGVKSPIYTRIAALKFRNYPDSI
jgi:hypothetical protein